MTCLENQTNTLKINVYTVRMANQKTTGISLNASKDGTHADLYLLGAIGDWWEGNTASAVLAQLSDPKIKTVDYYVSSVGGNFMEGLPIYNLLDMHSAFVTCNIIGYALSMGSVLPLAADKILCSENSLFMLHNAQGGVYGDYRELDKGAKVLKKHSQAIMPRYMQRMGKTEPEVQAILDETTWYTATEAKAAGLVDGFIDNKALKTNKTAQAAIKNQLSPEDARFAQKNFKNIPTDFARTIQNCITQDQSIVAKIMNTAVGTDPIIPDPTLNTQTLVLNNLDNLINQKDNDTVEQKDIDAIVSAVAEKVTNNVLTQLNATLDQREKAAEAKATAAAQQAKVDAALADSEAKLAAATAKLNEMQTISPYAQLPANNGPVDAPLMGNTGVATAAAPAVSNAGVPAI